MKLWRDALHLWYKDADEILREFAQSDIYSDAHYSEEIRLMYFISFLPPKGLGSTCAGDDFVKLWDYWCANKYKFTGAL